jgi:hypothetical protein
MKPLFLLALVNIILCFSTKAYTVQNDNTVTLEQYGAVGDGVQDDSKALQTAISSGKTILVSDKTYVINNNIYLYGNASIVGKAKSVFKINNDLSNADGKKFWFAIGITGKAASVRTWGGKITSITFTGSENAVFNYCINLFNADGGTISNCVFDWKGLSLSGVKGDPRGLSIESVNNASWCRSSNVKNMEIFQNKVLHKEDASGCEGIGISNGFNIKIHDNYVYGVADDAIAVHNTDGFEITNNKCYSTQGRIMMENSKNGVVKGNYVERIPRQISGGFNGGGALCMVEIGLANKNAYKPSNIQIINNYFKLPDGIPSPTYMLRAMAVDNCVISGNTFECNTKNGVSAIEIGMGNLRLITNNKRAAGMSSMQVNDFISPSNVTVTNNTCTGSHALGIYETGPKSNFKGVFKYESNNAKDYRINSDGAIFSHNKAGNISTNSKKQLSSGN